MNAQVTFLLQVFNLDTELSAEALGRQIEAKIEPMIHQMIKAAAENNGWLGYELETLLKENIPLSENAEAVFEVNNIQPKQEQHP